MCVEEISVGYRADAVFGGCDSQCILDPIHLMSVLSKASEKAGFTIVERISHAFQPHGITCAIILSQSHLIGHSWPEYDALIVNIFTCGEPDSIDIAIAAIRDGVKAEWMTSDVKEQSIRKARIGDDHG